jgi:hypothetical protein
MQVAYELPRTASGKVYHFSPNPDAVPRLFLIGDAPDERNIAPEDRQRIRREPGPGETVCPYSGFVAPDEDFVHADDIEAIREHVGWEFASDVEDWLANMAKDFNRRQPRNSFISINMDFKPNHRPTPMVLREDLLRDLQCDICQRAYAVYAIALFCPDCGASNVALHFDREVELVEQQVALAGAESKSGKSELAYRLMGNAHEDVLTAFETTLKSVYRHIVRQKLPNDATELCERRSIGNAFQNIERAQILFSGLSIDPFDPLSADDLEFLRVNIQKRHVIGHNLGVADGHYGELTQTEQPGETVNILGSEVERFATICAEVVRGLEPHVTPTNENGGASSSA